MPLRLYRVAAKPLERHEQAFYQSVATGLYPSKSEVVDLALPRNTVPLDAEACSKSAWVRDLIAGAIPMDASGVDAVIVDLTNPPYRLLPDHHVLGGLLDFLRTFAVNNHNEPVPVLLLMPVILAETDIAMRALQPLLATGVVNLIADDGTKAGTWPSLSSLDSVAYAKALSSIRQDPQVRLQRKMIRRPGHFKRRDRNGNHEYCLPFFFDGRFCTQELIDLIERHLHTLRLRDALPTIVYHCIESRWLYDAVASVCQTSPSQAIDGDLYLTDATRAPVVPANCLLVVPLIDTRGTVTALLAALLARNPTARISVLTVVTTERTGADGQHEPIAIGDRRFEVWPLMYAKRPRFRPGECGACRGNIDETLQGDQERFLQLTSFALWNMFLEAGTKSEEDVPSYRRSMGQVPDIRQVVHDNAAYLALKLDAMLQLDGQLPSDPVIIHPAENGAREIAKSLAGLYSYSCIEIPREALESVPSDRTVAMEWRRAFDGASDARWLSQLSSLEARGDIRVILMDEFNRSGETRIHLEKVARAFGLTVMCYLCFIDFCPGPEVRMPYRDMSLYQFIPEMAD